MDLEEETELQEERRRPRKKPRRIDEHPEAEVNLTLLDRLRVHHFFPAVDKLIAEIDRRFSNDLKEFKYLQPKHFFDSHAERSVLMLCSNYKDFLVPSKAITQWRIFRHTPNLEGQQLSDVVAAVPDHYSDLKMLYNIFLAMPITASSLERGFSKLPLVKSKLRTTMKQDRL